MTRAELIQAVSLRMDEITPSGALSGIAVDGADNNPLYALIDGLIDSCVLEVFSSAPYWRLPQKGISFLTPQGEEEVLSMTVFPGTQYERVVIRVRVMDDFLRIAEISHVGFARPITEVFPEQSTEGKRQHNKFLMAKSEKPFGVMSHGVWNDNDIHREIDCYSLPAAVIVSPANFHAFYVAKPATIDDDTAHSGANAVSVESVFGGSSILIPALEWLIASRTFGARGDVNHAAICQQNAQNLLV